MAASIWEVTQLILGTPGADAGDISAIAQAHGFTAGEVADLLPLVWDNVSVDYAESAGAPATVAPVPVAGEGVDELAARWLGELGARLQGAAGVVDLVSYDSFGAPTFDLDDFDPGLDPGFDDAGHATDLDAGRPGLATAHDVDLAADLDDGAGGAPEPSATFGGGDPGADGSAAGADGPQPAVSGSDGFAEPADPDDHFDHGDPEDHFGLDPDDLGDSAAGDLADADADTHHDTHHDAGPDLDGGFDGAVPFG